MLSTSDCGVGGLTNERQHGLNTTPNLFIWFSGTPFGANDYTTISSKSTIHKLGPNKVWQQQVLHPELKQDSTPEPPLPIRTCTDWGLPHRKHRGHRKWCWEWPANRTAAPVLFVKGIQYNHLPLYSTISHDSTAKILQPGTAFWNTYHWVYFQWRATGKPALIKGQKTANNLD